MERATPSCCRPWARRGTNLGPGTGNHYSEKILRPTPTVLTVLRPSSFMENLGANIVSMKTNGVLPVFGGDQDHRGHMIATRDTSAIAVDALLAPPTKTRTIELDGPRAYSYVDVATVASRLLGRPVVATAVPLEAMANALVQHAGFSPEVAELLVQQVIAKREGRLVYEHPVELTQFGGHPGGVHNGRAHDETEAQEVHARVQGGDGPAGARE